MKYEEWLEAVKIEVERQSKNIETDVLLDGTMPRNLLELYYQLCASPEETVEDAIGRARRRKRNALC